MELPSVTVIIPTYGKRSVETAPAAISAWRWQPVTEVWVAYGNDSEAEACDCPSPEEGLAPVYAWKAPVSVRTKFDYALAAMAETEYVICCDDDVIPKKGLVEDLLRHRKNPGNELLGLIGRRFTDPIYTNCPWFGAKKVDTVTAVDFVGVCIAAHQSMFGFNLQGMPTNADDLWLSMKVHPDADKWVVPSQNFENAPVKGMFHVSNLKAQRQRFYEKWWRACRHV